MEFGIYGLLDLLKPYFIWLSFSCVFETYIFLLPVFVFLFCLKKGFLGVVLVLSTFFYLAANFHIGIKFYIRILGSAYNVKNGSRLIPLLNFEVMIYWLLVSLLKGPFAPLLASNSFTVNGISVCEFCAE